MKLQHWQTVELNASGSLRRHRVLNQDSVTGKNSVMEGAPCMKLAKPSFAGAGTNLKVLRLGLRLRAYWQRFKLLLLKGCYAVFVHNSSF